METNTQCFVVARNRVQKSRKKLKSEVMISESTEFTMFKPPSRKKAAMFQPLKTETTSPEPMNIESTSPEPPSLKTESTSPEPPVKIDIARAAASTSPEPTADWDFEKAHAVWNADGAKYNSKNIRPGTKNEFRIMSSHGQLRHP
jgi:hypothetical protein